MRRLFVLLSFLILAAVSCTNKELCYDHSHVIEVDVAFDWSNAPDAAPESMSLYLFSEDGTNPQRYEFAGCEGGTIRVVPGIYHAICLNSDTENICHRNTETYSTYTLTTDEVPLLAGMSVFGFVTKSPPMAKGTEDQSVIAQSEKLWCHQASGLELSEHGQGLTMYPEVAYTHVTVEIQNVDNLVYTTAISGVLSGMADGYMVGLDQVTDGLATIPFELNQTGETDALAGELYAFGHCPESAGSHVLTVYAVLRDGTQWYYSFDVTEQMHEDEDHAIHIVLDHLPIPEPEPGTGEGGGGFIPTIDDWNTMYFDINM